MRKALLGLVLLSLAGCPSQTPPARAQEAASELNTNQRFGRMELVAERVSEPSREKFFERRKAWGSKIQIADSEVMGFKMKGDDQAEIMLRIAWYKVDEGDLHATTIKQSWKDFRGSWKLIGEERTDGELGLFGDAPPPDPSAKTVSAFPSAPKKSRFATIRLGQGDEPAQEASPPADAAKTQPADEPTKAEPTKAAAEPAKADPAKADAPKPEATAEAAKQP
jgi:hypothetical protein